MTGLTQATDVVVAMKDGDDIQVHLGLPEMIGIERAYRHSTTTRIHPDGTIETTEEDVPHVERLLYGVWLAIGQPDADFDAWMATTESFREEEVDAVPSQPAAGAGS